MWRPRLAYEAMQGWREALRGMLVTVITGSVLTEYINGAGKYKILLPVDKVFPITGSSLGIGHRGNEVHASVVQGCCVSVRNIEQSKM